jgi:hypothetical protein
VVICCFRVVDWYYFVVIDCFRVLDLCYLVVKHKSRTLKQSITTK